MRVSSRVWMQPEAHLGGEVCDVEYDEAAEEPIVRVDDAQQRQAAVLEAGDGNGLCQSFDRFDCVDRFREVPELSDESVARAFGEPGCVLRLQGPKRSLFISDRQ